MRIYILILTLSSIFGSSTGAQSERKPESVPSSWLSKTKECLQEWHKKEAKGGGKGFIPYANLAIGEPWEDSYRSIFINEEGSFYKGKYKQKGLPEDVERLSNNDTLRRHPHGSASACCIFDENKRLNNIISTTNCESALIRARKTDYSKFWYAITHSCEGPEKNCKLNKQKERP
jgi:hypothetical protein